MRLVLAIALLASCAVCAQAAEDRYGPPRAGPPAGVTARPYAGSTLSWVGKPAAPAPRTTTLGAPARPEVLPGGLYSPAAVRPQGPATLTPPPRPAAAAVAYAAPPQAPLTLYDRPAPQAAGLPPPPPAPGGLYASGGARFYSVHRPYGEQPDPIPPPPAGDGMAFRPEASLAGPVALSGAGDGVRKDDDDEDMSGFGGVGAFDDAEEAEREMKREARRDAERAAARRAAAGGGQ